MPATEAQIRANQQNAARSTGPKTEEGKARSSRNALKHGLTGAGVVLPEDDAAEVEQLDRALRDELKPPGRAGSLLVRQMATMAMRMERSFVQETAALAERVRKVMDEFEPPEGVDAETVAKLRVEAGHIALFDPSKGACLARKYEAAASRNFYRALNDLRQLKRESARGQESDDLQASASKVTAEALSSFAKMGSFLQGEKSPTPTPSRPTQPAPIPYDAPAMPWEMARSNAFDLPMTIGKRR